MRGRSKTEDEDDGSGGDGRWGRWDTVDRPRLEFDQSYVWCVAAVIAVIGDR